MYRCIYAKIFRYKDIDVGVYIYMFIDIQILMRIFKFTDLSTYTSYR